MVIKRADIRRFLEIVEKIKASKNVNLKFASAIYKIKKKIDEEIEFITNELPKILSDEYREFEMRREAILRKYSSSIDQDTGRYVISPERFNDLTTEMEELAKQYTEEQLAEIKKAEGNVREFMEEKVNIDIEPVKIDIIPDNILSYADIEFLLDIGAIVE